MFSPETKKTGLQQNFHVPVIRSRLPHQKFSEYQKNLGNGEDENIFSKTSTNFGVRANHLKNNEKNNEEESPEMIKKLAFSEVFENSRHKKISISSPNKVKNEENILTMKPLAFSAKASKSSTNSQDNTDDCLKIELNVKPFKRKSAMMLKNSPSNGYKTKLDEQFNFSPNEKKNDFKLIPVEFSWKKDELIDQIQKKINGGANNNEINMSKKQNLAKKKLFEAFEKAEIYNDKVVRQINFEKENQEEEKNFQELYDALHNLN